MDKRTVLIVDDDKDILEVVADALTDQGYHVVSALSSAAIPAALAERPDVILLDLMMPDMNGVEVSQRLRANPRTADIPIIAMSAQERLHRLRRHVQADDVLAKPFDLAHLYETVARWARRS